VRCPLRIPLAFAFLFVATTTSAAPTRLLTASFSVACDAYAIAVTGEGSLLTWRSVLTKKGNRTCHFQFSGNSGASTRI